MVPDGWKNEIFGKIVNLSNAKHDPKKSTINFPCIELEHLTQETGKITGCTDSTKLESTKNKFKAGNVLFGKLRPYLKKYAKPDFDGVCSSEIWVFVPAKKLDENYLFQFVQTDSFIAEANKSSGSKMPRADWSVISEFLFPLPPLPEQKTIAKMLSTWDSAITTIEKLLINSEQQKKALMQQLLTGKKRFPAFSDEWKKFELGDVFVRVTNGLTYDSKATNGLPTTRIETISTGKINYSKVGWAPKEENTLRFKLKQGDILYSHINSLEHIGRVAFYEGELPLYHGMNLLLLRVNSGFSNLFLFHVLNSHVGKKYAKIYAKSAVNQASISTTDLKSFKVRLPELKEQQKIASVLSSAEHATEELRKKIGYLKQEKKALMQQLLTGKRRVKL